jgi:sulfide:quinone oxidoreductase
MIEQPFSPTPHRVLIAGGGVAALEAMLTLRELAGDRVAVTLVAPDDTFAIRAHSVEHPFARPAARRYDLGALCAAQRTAFHRDAMRAVYRGGRLVTTVRHRELHFDSLLVAVGARPVPAYPGALTFRGLEDSEAMHGLIEDVEGGYVPSLAFVAPPGVRWTLPIYELALLSADRAQSLCLDVAVTVYTAEHEPLEDFGAEASRRMRALLAARRITLRTHTRVQAADHGTLVAAGGRVVGRARRVVALPVAQAPRLPGLPVDVQGFLPVDEHGRVKGTVDLFAAGDVTSHAVKQGGLAAQQAEAAATAIAARAGAPVTAWPFRPVLRAELVTGGAPLYLRGPVDGDALQAGAVSNTAMWWPPAKVAAPRLSAYLERLDAARAATRPAEVLR